MRVSLVWSVYSHAERVNIGNSYRLPRIIIKCAGFHSASALVAGRKTSPRLFSLPPPHLKGKPLPKRYAKKNFCFCFFTKNCNNDDDDRETDVTIKSCSNKKKCGWTRTTAANAMAIHESSHVSLSPNRDNFVLIRLFDD